MSIYLPNSENAKAQEFITEWVSDPTGSFVDDFRTALMNYLEIPNSRLSTDDLWALFIADQYTTFVGQHILHYEGEDDFEFPSPEE